VPQGVNGSAQENAYTRIKNSKDMTAQLPFQTEAWLSIYAPSCPGKHGKGNDRGVTMSHYQIWSDFLFHTKDEKTYDDLIMVVFEDDAVIAVKNVTHSLEVEIGSMDTDLLFLGWCYGRRHMPMCTHSYALSRNGAKKIVDNWDLCNPSAIDGQWKHLAKAEKFTWKKALPTSYADLKAGFDDNPDYFTRGIFTQKSGLVSFNHHGFQKNAG